MSINFPQFQNQELVIPLDLTQMSDSSRTVAGDALAMILGAANALPSAGPFEPLAIALSGSDLTFAIGGAGQGVITADPTSGTARVVDNCPSSNFTLTPNSGGSARIDLVSIQYQQTTTNPQTREFGPPGSPTTGTVYNLQETAAYNYTAGTTSPPSGYVAFAQISVPPGATTASECTVTYQFGTIAALLKTLIGSVVSTLNGLSGPVEIVEGSGITVAIVDGQIVISSDAAANVSSLNGLTGALALVQGSGILINVDSMTGQISITANPPSNQVGASIVNFVTGGSGATSLTVALATLTAGTWIVEAMAHGFEWSGSGNAHIQGSGAGFTDESGCGNGNATRTLFIAGTCAGGVTPSVTYTASAGTGLQPNTTHVTLLIRATRIS